MPTTAEVPGWWCKEPSQCGDRDRGSATEMNSIGLDRAIDLCQAHAPTPTEPSCSQQAAARAGAGQLRHPARLPCRHEILSPCRSRVARDRQPRNTAKLIALAHVKPSLRRLENGDAYDAALLTNPRDARPRLRGREVRGHAASHGDLPGLCTMIGRRAQLINANRGHLAASSRIAARGSLSVAPAFAQIGDLA